jgi:hypothetical protein
MTKFYNLLIKEYVDGQSTIALYQNSIPYELDKTHTNGVRGQSMQRQKNIIDATHRAKTSVYDLTKSNNWEYFITITFDKAKINRYDAEEIGKRFAKLLNNIKNRKCSNLKYILVPELHQDGAIHFHGLLSNTEGLTFEKTPYKAKNGLYIYNVLDFNLGFTTATKVTDTHKASNYITKYITKEIIATNFNKKHYWSSKNLDKPRISKSHYTKKDTNDLVSSLQNISTYTTETNNNNDTSVQKVTRFYL